mgnify:CR=1 FL=1
MDKLLELLKEHGRASTEELAEQLEMSPEDVEQQIRDYETNGIIKGYKAIINREELPETSIPVVALVELTISPQPDTGFEAVAHEIEKHPQVTDCYLCSGDYDLLVRIESDEMREISNFIARELAPNPNITETVSHFLLKTYKEDRVRFDGEVSDQRLSISL